MKRNFFSLAVVAAFATFAILIAQPPPDPAKVAEAADLQKQIDAAKATKQNPPAQPPAPMPNPPPAPLAAVPHPRGHVTPPQAVLAARHALARARHDDKMANLPTATPPAMDIRTLSWVGTIDDQANCGSCWDVSATGVITDQYIKKGLAKADGSWKLSPQYVLDGCGGKNGGCNGDDAPTVLDMCKNKGLPTTADYGPYTAAAHTCRYTNQKLWTINDWGYCTPAQQQGVASTQDIKNAIMQYGTISTAIVADSSWDSVGSDGVIKYEKSSPNAVDHDVAIIGWDDAKKIPGTSKLGAWIVKNQWGTSWGNGGYCWIAYGSHQIGTEAAWVNVSAGPPPPALVAVPNVTGTTYALANSTLIASGFMVLPANADGSSLVTGQTPPAGTQAVSGSTVTLTLNTPPPPLNGDIVVTIPKGTPAGSYTIGKSGGLTDEEAAQLAALVAKAVGRPNPNPPPVIDPDDDSDAAPTGFLDDVRVHDKIAAALAADDAKTGRNNAAKYEKLRAKKFRHRLFVGMVARKMARQPDGAQLLDEYKSDGALPPGFLDNLAKFFATIMPLILEILKLFGIGGAFAWFPRRMLDRFRNADWPTKV